MRSSDDLLRAFVAIRARRDWLRSERAGLLCERSPESLTPNPETFELPKASQDEPCWKAARKWEDDGYRTRFYLDPPPSQWCASCRRRQEVNDEYRVVVRLHAGALRGLLRRGRALETARVSDAVAKATE